MKLTRHNYEEYFILYMDNELAPAERRMVEDFVQLHPDLNEELDQLLQYKLIPDTNIVFSGKEELLQGQQETFINLSNYEEYLLLYTDNELNAAEKTAVEQFAAENLAVKKELNLLNFTRLQPERVEFPDKASLYRKEEKVRALPVRWWRAAAAVLILGLGLTAVWVINRKPENETVAGANPGKNEIKSTTPILPNATKEALANQETNQPGNSNTATEGVMATNTPDNTPIARTSEDQTANSKNKAEQPVNNDAVANRQRVNKSNNLPEPVNNPNVNIPQDDLAVNPVPANNNPKGILTNTGVTNKTGSSPDIKPGIGFAVAKSDDPEIETAVNDGKKSKLRGFFRKVTRTFEKRTNIDPTDQDNRLLVGGLAIKLK